MGHSDQQKAVNGGERRGACRVMVTVIGCCGSREVLYRCVRTGFSRAGTKTAAE